MARATFSAYAICYAIISLPYVALALNMDTFNHAHHRRTHHTDRILERASSADSPSEAEFAMFPHKLSNELHVNSSSINRNIPEDRREVFYFRNHTMVGKKSEGFDLAQFDKDTGHPDRSNLTAAERLEAGDISLTKVAVGAGLGITAAAATLAFCVVLSSSCGTFIGNNIRNFVAAVHNLPASSGAAGQAAGEFLNNVAGNPPPALPGASRLARREWQLREEFGCFYEHGYDGTCVNEAVTDSAYQTVVNDDGANSDTPIWSCYEAKDSSTGTTYGFYSHCFGANENCELQCGIGNPEVTEAPGSLGSD